MENHWNNNGPATYTEQDISDAIAAGAFTEDAARSLREYVAGQRQSMAAEPENLLAKPASSIADEENFRLVGGFNDIFVALASIMFLGAFSWLLPTDVAGLLVAAFAWVLAEYFVRRKHLALTAILLLISYMGGVFFASCSFLISLSSEGSELVPSPGQVAISAAIVAGATALHWRRFHVPITIAGAVAACAGMLIAGVMSLTDSNEVVLAFMLLFCGVFVFVLAMQFDSKDPHRRTRKSDIAFWLHLLASPMLVHPIFFFMGVFDDSITFAHAIVIIAIYIVMAFVSVCVDRRAMMVSSLAYVIYAFNFIISEYGALDIGIALAALIIGTALLSLSALWQPIRAFIVRKLPPHVQEKLPTV
ncbi:MAG: hypothetical protein LBV04_00135 [Deferribacteraceae bacterium]|jgi:hypothetical protein|nr:hypothetical protein [Deferribacteraceae bacterium]